MIDRILESLTPEHLGVAALIYVGFVVALFLGSRFLPGRDVEGVQLADGTRQRYRLNGLLLYGLTFALMGVAAAVWGAGVFSPLITTYFWPVLVVSNLFSVLLTLVLYVQGRSSGDVPEGEHLIKTLWMGAELNPTWWGVDLKVFSYRPSLIGLGVLNVSFAFTQYDLYGGLSTPMVLYQSFYFFYLASSFQYEHGMLSMWDVIAERFGFMLIWGDYALVTFFYCLPAWFLVEAPSDFPLWASLGLCAMFMFGFWVFRGTNEQKNQFKRDPEALIWGKKPEMVGGRLLVSGFWGIGRKLNYSGEILVYFSWTLTTGFDDFWPYLLPLWLLSLLLHRAWRDEQRCHAKYGEIWDAYCQRARFRMIPFIY